MKDKNLGFRIRTKDYAKPIFISPGYGLPLESCIEITKKCLKQHKLPEPLYYAHKYAKKVLKENQ